MSKNNKNILAVLQHSNLENGEFVIKFGDEWFTGKLTQLEFTAAVGQMDTVKLQGYLGWYE